MAAANYDILIEQGATFTLSIVWKDDEGVPIDISDCEARMQIRRTYDSDPIISLTTESDGGIVLGGVTGSVDVEVDAETTENVEIRRGLYDLEIVFPDDVVVRLIQGSVEISREVTK